MSDNISYNDLVEVLDPEDWLENHMIEIEFNTEENEVSDFLTIQETLTRIGIPNREKNVLTQSCHILHKRGRYYIVSFLEMFILDGRTHNLKIIDVARRNRIVTILEEWGLIKLPEYSKEIMQDYPDTIRPSLKIIPYRDKDQWKLVSKYTIGGKGNY